jgi:hypothetical protein
MSRMFWMWVQTICVVGPIVVLLSIGVFLTLRSGLTDARRPARERSPRRWTLVVDASRTLLAVAGSIVLLAVLQELIGIPRVLWR